MSPQKLQKTSFFYGIVMFDHSNLYKSSPEEEEIAAGNGITPVRLFIHLKLLPAKDLEDVNLLERNEGKEGLNRLYCRVVVRVLDRRYIQKTGLSSFFYLQIIVSKSPCRSIL